MKVIPLLFVYALCVLSSGCALSDNLIRTAVIQPIQFSHYWDEKRQHLNFRRWAAWEWERVCATARAELDNYECEPFSADEAQGFQEGFVDYLLNGGTGQPPPLPPRRYWRIKHQNGDGYRAMQDWFKGYSHGAAVAKATEYRNFVTVPTSDALVQGTLPFYLGQIADLQCTEPEDPDASDEVDQDPAGILADVAAPVDGTDFGMPPSETSATPSSTASEPQLDSLPFFELDLSPEEQSAAPNERPSPFGRRDQARRGTAPANSSMQQSDSKTAPIATQAASIAVPSDADSVDQIRFAVAAITSSDGALTVTNGQPPTVQVTEFQVTEFNTNAEPSAAVAQPENVRIAPESSFQPRQTRLAKVGGPAKVQESAPHPNSIESKQIASMVKPRQRPEYESEVPTLDFGADKRLSDAPAQHPAVARSKGKKTVHGVGKSIKPGWPTAVGVLLIALGFAYCRWLSAKNPAQRQQSKATKGAAPLPGGAALPSLRATRDAIRDERTSSAVSRRCQAATLALLASCLLSGCASLTNPVLNGIPVRRLPPELLAAPRREALQTIPLSLLRHPQPENYILGPGDVMGVFIAGVFPLTLADQALPTPPVRFPSQIDPLGAGLPPSLGYPVRVRNDGRLALPLVEPILLEGLTVEEANERIRDAYVRDGILQPGREAVMVTLMQPRQVRVLVFRQEVGGFAAGGRGDISSNNVKQGTGHIVDLRAYENDVLTALANTGGLPGLDAFDGIFIFRGGQSNTALTEVLKSAQSHDPSSLAEICVKTDYIPTRWPPDQPLPFEPDDVLLHEGDVLLLEARVKDFFYTGGLLPVGERLLPRDYDLDVVEAVAQVTGTLVNGAFGGNNFLGRLIQQGIGNPNPSALTVIRRTPNGGQVPISVDLNRALIDPRERILVQPDDVLILQESGNEAIARYMNDIFNFNLAVQAIQRGSATGTAAVTQVPTGR